MKGLEALNNLRKIVDFKERNNIKLGGYYLQTIEKELKALELLKKTVDISCLQVFVETNTLTQEEVNELKEGMSNDYFVIYCVNNYHNLYMDYNGETTSFDNATKFRNELDAHEFLRKYKHKSSNVFSWKVFNINELKKENMERVD